jgi:hypothetical protein
MIKKYFSQPYNIIGINKIEAKKASEEQKKNNYKISDTSVEKIIEFWNNKNTDKYLNTLKILKRFNSDS